MLGQGGPRGVKTLLANSAGHLREARGASLGRQGAGGAARLWRTSRGTDQGRLASPCRRKSCRSLRWPHPDFPIARSATDCSFRTGPSALTSTGCSQSSGSHPDLSFQVRWQARSRPLPDHRQGETPVALVSHLEFWGVSRRLLRRAGAGLPPRLPRLARRHRTTGCRSRSTNPQPAGKCGRCS
jgi:hypothetical protein